MKKIILANAIIIASFVIVLVTPSSALAESRLQFCNNFANNKDTAKFVPLCLNNLIQVTVDFCKELPEADRDPCTQNYQNGEITEPEKKSLLGVDENNSKNNDSGNQPPTISNAEREALQECDGRTDPANCLKNNPIFSWTLVIINFLSVGVGVVVTIIVIIGGIQYASAGANPQAVMAAKKRIVNALLALVAYFFLFAFLQWLVPGGVL